MVRLGRRATAPLTRRDVEWRSPSAAMAIRMMPPWIARSQYALTPRKVSAGPIAASRVTPSTVPATLPVPPVTEVPPTTTAAITFISRPRPALLGIWLKRTALSTAASPVSDPSTVKATHFTADVSRPARRAAPGFEPVA